MAAVLRDPAAQLPGYLGQPHQAAELWWTVALPWCAIRPVAILLRAGWAGDWAPGVVLAIGSFVLQVSVWLAFAASLPMVVRPFGLHLPERQALALAALVCAPLWLAGALFLAPEDPPSLFLLTRLCVLAIASYGLVLLSHALTVLAAPPQARLPIVATAGTTFLLVYLGLFATVGIAANIALFLLGAGA